MAQSIEKIWGSRRSNNRFSQVRISEHPDQLVNLKKSLFSVLIATMRYEMRGICTKYTITVDAHLCRRDSKTDGVTRFDPILIHV